MHVHPEPVDALACPAGLDTARLHDEVQRMYERVAADPAPGAFHFHVGAAYAAERLGYDAAALAALPASATARFAGLGNPLLAGPVPDAALVLDHACGAGTDLMLALRRGGPAARGIGIDLTPGMREAARRALREAGLTGRIEVAAGSFDALPLPAASVDLVLSNGVLNLATDKRAVLREAWRVLRPGGALYLADVVASRPLAEAARRSAALWAACIGGALTEAELVDALLDAGFGAPRIAARHRPFDGTSLPLKLGPGLDVTSVTLAARKPLLARPAPRPRSLRSMHSS
jgi:arsenite methyltransferase